MINRRPVNGRGQQIWTGDGLGLALSFVEMASSPLFSFDGAELQRMQDALPTDLHLLRLRLRFGLPLRVVLGQRFRVVVDVVDEMGQPLPKNLSLPEGVDISLAFQHSGAIDNQLGSSMGLDELHLRIEERHPPTREKRREAKWVFWASLQPSQGSCALPIDARVGLRIQMKQTPALEGDSFKDRGSLQNFCVGSAWLNERVLVLPLQVELQVASTGKMDSSNFTSTVCQRLFRVLPSSNSAVAEDLTEEGNMLIVEEHYGDAMGAHVWDASILLSWAVLRAGTIASATSGKDEPVDKQVMLELGSGCGLFAAVLTKFQPQVKTIFTEKPECRDRLQANLDRNRSPPSSSVSALEWGTSLPSLLRDANVRVVFAADVLYNWAAHEAFLATLDNLVQAQEPDTKMQVFVAHKRRGKTSAGNLDALVSGTFDPVTQCGILADKGDCRWNTWHVDKLPSLGRIDLFILSRR